MTRDILKIKHMPLSKAQSKVVTSLYYNVHCVPVAHIISDTVVCSLLAIFAVYSGLNPHSVLVMAGKQKEVFRAAGLELSAPGPAVVRPFSLLFHGSNTDDLEWRWCLCEGF